MLQAGPLISLSPSFNSYSSSGQSLADIAARVVSELRRDSGNDAVYLYDDDHFDTYRVERSELSVDDDDYDDDQSEFEFAFVGRESASSPISADEIFHNGRIRAVYPLFGKQRNDNVGVQASGDGNDETALPPPPPPPLVVRRRQPLRKLMVEEGFAASSCSSSETDELDGLKDGTYCVWRPKNGGDERKKSKSTGTVSRRWKFRGFLIHRSNSGDGKGDSADETPATFLVSSRKCPDGDNKGISKGEKIAGKGTVTGKDEDEKKRSFLPYKQDLVGFLANVNGLSRNLHPF